MQKKKQIRHYSVAPLFHKAALQFVMQWKERMRVHKSWIEMIERFCRLLSKLATPHGQLTELEPQKNVRLKHGKLDLNFALPRQAVSLLVLTWN